MTWENQARGKHARAIVASRTSDPPCGETPSPTGRTKHKHTTTNTGPGGGISHSEVPILTAQDELYNVDGATCRMVEREPQNNPEPNTQPKTHKTPPEG